MTRGTGGFVLSHRDRRTDQGRLDILFDDLTPNLSELEMIMKQSRNRMMQRDLVRLRRLLHRRMHLRDARIKSIGHGDELRLICEWRPPSERGADSPPALRSVWRTRVELPDNAQRSVLLALARAVGDIAMRSGVGLDIFASSVWFDVRNPRRSAEPFPTRLAGSV
jgi:hypothetical protein